MSPIFKLHLFLGMTIFLLFPFTRLVHIWSAPVWYFGRTGYQVVRTTRPIRTPLGRHRRRSGARRDRGTSATGNGRRLSHAHRPDPRHHAHRLSP